MIGYFFGEIDILFGETRKHSYRAQTDCTLLGMTKKNFSKIFFQEFQEIGAEVYNNALKRRVRQLKSYKEALAYCRANAHEDDKKYKPQTSNLFKGKLSIQGKNFLDSRLHFDEDSIVKAANSIIPETKVPETRDDGEDGAGEEEEEELTARRELSNRTKNSKEKSEDSDRSSKKRSKSDESIVSESADVSSISEVGSRARSSLGLDIITKSQAQMTKSVKIEEDNNKPKSKKEVKMKGWTLVRHQLIKKRSTLRKTSKGPMSSGNNNISFVKLSYFVLSFFFV